MAVFLSYYDCLSITKDGPEEPISHPLFRRMTPIQRAGVGIFVRAGRALGADWATMLQHDGCEILFATAYGEVGANYQVSSGVVHASFPLSPKDFQHSLANATAGYLALTQGLTQNIMTVTHGFLSLDKALHYAVHLLGRSGVRHVVLIHANECLWPDTPLIAKAEILRFSREGAAGDYELIQAAAMNRPPHDDCSVNCERGPDDAGPHAISYFDLPQAGEVYRRFVSNKNGEGFYSEWRRCAVP